MCHTVHTVKESPGAPMISADKSIRIGYITTDDVMYRRGFSGIHYYQFKALSEQFQTVISCGPLLQPRWLRRIFRVINRIHLILFNKRADPRFNCLTSLYFGFRIRRFLAQNKIDVAFASAADAELAMLKVGFLAPDVPVCYSTDATFNLLHEYYWTPEFTEFPANYSPWSIRERHFIQKRAIDISQTIIYSSNWARIDAINYYKANKSKVHVVKYGANLDVVPEIKALQARKENPFLTVLFVSADWYRKGGPIVLETANILKRRKVNIRINIVSTQDIPCNSIVKSYPPLNKDIEKESRQLADLFLESDVFFLPTRADCTPIVFNEAAAYGLPVLTTDTGGCSSLVTHELNGFLLPEYAEAKDFADKLQLLSRDKTLLNNMSNNSRALYESEHNWTHWGQSVANILTGMANRDFT